ncbi:hypothetical protein X769_24690 [Mesorhizobium sp. LSJC268A00]|uniref:DUF2934 domain-containing protein n=1 Tax=unclassified Mesorhizobium TaxID=325217 RepID=UPI0003CE08B7|nr:MULTISPECIES: DUF2934 domain-containing protein [unclassified Mesorhizobium]ESW64849.1 hypothetical protein X771_24510 [Mesorhizobium sp. LSJC277A00]ESW85879.1 hypothetical protein X770_20935 [Mesorhizobium sp. LSJC269B00]ESW99098.1 hypothetical protein X769_24690 [Mesorhizobium sp. LSJC268A00]ESX46471.1 hypothetical protein X762_20650 [Mesorhizobium sp. LSHC426A00]ESX54445.1 hypothetical protein X761_17590 [Mesorhizobium sp. LSHC424B00]
MTDDKQDRIRQRAHEIWEKAGRPEGAHQEHWEQATAEVDGAVAKPKKAAKKADAKPAKAAAKPKAAKPAAAKSGKAKSK